MDIPSAPVFPVENGFCGAKDRTEFRGVEQKPEIALDQLRAVAGLYNPPQQPRLPQTVGPLLGQKVGPQRPRTQGRSDFDSIEFVERFAADNNIVLGPRNPYKDGVKWQIDCPFDSSHASPDAALYVTGNGAIGFHCSHNSCAGRDWHAVRDKFDMGWRDRLSPVNRNPAPSLKAVEYPDRTGYKLTELGNAERLAGRCGNDLRYCCGVGWLVYDGTRWRIDTNDARVSQLYSLVIREIADEAESILKIDSESVLGKALKSWAVGSESNGRRAATLEWAQRLPGLVIESAMLDHDPWLLNVQNGTIDLRSGHLRPHHRDDLITRIAPTVYDPDAVCPIWEASLSRWQPGATGAGEEPGDVRAFLQRAFGYSLTGSTGEETAFLLYGEGRNGKSKFVGALETVLGHVKEGGYCGRINVAALMDSRKGGAVTPDLVDLVGARFVVGSEIEAGRRINEATIKDLTGSDYITVNPKHQAVFTFRPQFKLWLYSNHKPQIQNVDEGIKARLPLIPFTVFIPENERDTALAQKLAAEASGILAWAVRGCLEWQKGRLNAPPSVIAATDEYHRSQDRFADFFDNRCVFATHCYARLPDLRQAYMDFTGESDERRIPSQNQFAERLRSAGGVLDIRKIAGKTVRVWVGIGLKDEIRNDSDSHQNGPVTPVTPVTPESETFKLAETAEKPKKDQKVTPVTPVTPPGNTQARGRAQDFYYTNLGVTGVTGVTEEIEEESRDSDEEAQRKFSQLVEARRQFDDAARVRGWDLAFPGTNPRNSVSAGPRRIDPDAMVAVCSMLLRHKITPSQRNSADTWNRATEALEGLPTLDWGEKALVPGEGPERSVRIGFALGYGRDDLAALENLLQDPDLTQEEQIAAAIERFVVELGDGREGVRAIMP